MTLLVLTGGFFSFLDSFLYVENPMPFRKLSILFFLSLLLLTSCASVFDLPEIDWKNGAKRGWVMELYGPGASETELPVCLSKLSKSNFATKQFVKVNYREGRRMFVEVAALLDGAQAKFGDQVELWPEEGSSGKLFRISRSFPVASQ